MGMFLGIDAAASGMTAERLRMDLISNNIANANTTRTENGGAYHRRFAVFEPRDRSPKSFEQTLMKAVGIGQQTGEGVRAVSIMEDNTQGPLVYDPSHPDANADGYVEKPNVSVQQSTPPKPWSPKLWKSGDDFNRSKNLKSDS